MEAHELRRYFVKSYQVVGWTIEGSVLCPNCVVDDMLDEDQTMPIFADSEWQGQPVCDVCHEPIEYVTVLEVSGE